MANVILVAKGFGPGDIDHGVLRKAPLGDGHFGDVLDMDGLDGVVSKAEHSEHGKASEHPSNVVDQDVSMPTEQDGRP